MARKSDRPSTSDTFRAATYRTAESVNVDKKISTVARTEQIRTVTTSAKEGSVGLRYAPHNPKVIDVDTTS